MMTCPAVQQPRVKVIMQLRQEESKGHQLPLSAIRAQGQAQKHDALNAPRGRMGGRCHRIKHTQAWGT